MKLPGIYPLFTERWKDYQDVYLYSDPHFGDIELQNSIKRRPSDEEQLKLINSKIGRKSIFICLGDVGDIEYAKRIRGYKILILGNHDSGITNYQDIFDEIYAGPLIIGEKLILSHEPIEHINWAMNVHGHIHDLRRQNDKYHYNVCADHINYTPVNLNQLLKTGFTSKINSIHRQTINEATIRKKEKNERSRIFVKD